MTMGRVALGFVCGAMLLGSFTGGAWAATARTSNAVTVYAGPGYGYAAIGRLPRNRVVTLSECTPSARWCRISGSGWVLGSYLVGEAAKVNVTPFRPLVNPFFHPRPHGWRPF